MNKNYHRQSYNRSSSRSYGSSRRQPRKANKQTIDPARFIKAAAPIANTNYQARHEFAEFDMNPLLKSNLNALGFTEPSEIQDKTIKLGLEGKSVIGIANTGTGKTAAFALPILNKLMASPSSQALIIAPTRELALQIEEQCRTLARSSGLFSAILIGGTPIGRQKSDLRQRPRIIIGTPGRIKDHLNQGTLNLAGCNMVVLDEVDRMLDMGFINDVRYILAKLSQNHQAFFFSATLNPQIRNLIDTFVENPELVNVKVGETSEHVNQDVVRYSGNSEKINSLHDVLIRQEVQKTLVFGETKHGVDRLGKELVARGFKADALHGGKSQGQRKRALDAFRNNQVNVLVATDVAARGIDVKDITHVINYDTPHTYDDYVHRVGRAGRAGRPGYALTFVEN